jgi:nucleoside-diphosphate-sugar epimerase
MSKNGREFLKASVLGGAAVAAGLPILSSASEEKTQSKSLDLLVLGGTGFIGPHMVREALRRGHNVTLFNRGKTNNKLFPDLESIKGDRAGDLAGIKNREWDVVVDNSGYMPQYVRNSARTLAPNIGHYLFISSISAYESFAQPIDENSPLATMEDENAQEFSWDYYGALKVRCEKRAAEEMGDDRLTVLRPTYICGPGDHTDRFTYWPVRTAKGGEMLWAGTPASEIQIIDVRDLANFVVDCVERRTAGTYNMVTPAGSYTMGNLLEDSQAVLSATVDPIWVDDAFVEEQNAGAEGALPIWHPSTGPYAHVSSVSGERARAEGLRNRPVRETIRDLMTWWDTLPEERITNARFGMTAEREAELIAAWKDSIT